MTDPIEETILPPGTPIGDRYVIGQQLGRGGFAVVYVARHRYIDNLRVAIKILRAEHADSEMARRRFLREAQAVAALRTRHVVRVTDAGEFGDRRPYLVMELCEGETLDEVLDRKGTMNAWDVARLSMQILLAMEEAHAAGIIHRDLKPANVFVVQDSHEPHPIAKVGDFGIARITDGARLLPPSMTMSANGGIVCTPLYAAPELLDGQPGPSSDLYALGHLMAELLDGVAPYAARKQPLLVCAAHLDPEPVPLGPRTLNSPLASIVSRAVEKKASARWQSATEMREAIATIFPEIPEPEFPLVVRRRSWERPTTGRMAGVGAESNAVEETAAGPPRDAAAQTALAETLDAVPAGQSGETERSAAAHATPASIPVPLGRSAGGPARAILVVGIVALVTGIGLLVVGGREPAAPAGDTPSAGNEERAERRSAVVAAEADGADVAPDPGADVHADGGSGAAAVAVTADGSGSGMAPEATPPATTDAVDPGPIEPASELSEPPVEAAEGSTEALRGDARTSRRRPSRRSEPAETDAPIASPESEPGDGTGSPFRNLRVR